MAQAEFACPSCSQRLQVAHDALPRRMACARCGTSFRPLDVIGLEVPLPAIPVDEAPCFPMVETPVVPSEPPPGAAPAPAEPPSAEPAPEAGPAPADAVHDAGADPAVPRGRGGTIILRAQPAQPRRGAAVDLRRLGLSALDEATRLAHAAVDFAEARLKERQLLVVKAAGAAIALTLLIVVALLRPSGGRSFLSLLAALAVGAVVVGGAAVGLSRRGVVGGGPSPAWLRPSVFAGGLALALGVGGGLTGALAGALASAPEELPSSAHHRVDAYPTRVIASAIASAPPAEERAPTDAELDRDGKDSLGGGFLYVPESFRPRDAALDVLVHFNGVDHVVVRSAALAELDAVVLVINQQRGSRFLDQLGDPAAFPALLEQVRAAVEKRGLRGARLGRVAVSSFGMGSGTLAKILGVASSVQRIDAVLILDGLTVSWARDAKDQVDSHQIAPFLAFARLAADGKKLLAITHSSIRTKENAGAGDVADALLADVGGARAPSEKAPPPVEIEGAENLFPKRAIQQLEAGTAARVKDFHVAGYSNTAPQHQAAHLVQMSVTVLPLLVERWRGAPQP